jgi:hypothetical protein
VSAPVARLSAAIFLLNVPRRPLTAAASETLPVSLASKAGSTAPVVGFSLTIPRRATPLTAENVPPT